MYSGRTQRDKDRLAETITENAVNRRSNPHLGNGYYSVHYLIVLLEAFIIQLY
jgi:hypothetical protein